MLENDARVKLTVALLGNPEFVKKYLHLTPMRLVEATQKVVDLSINKMKEGC